MEQYNDLLSLTIPGTSGAPVKITAPTGIPQGVSLGQLLTAGITIAMIIGLIVALFYFAYGGFYWIQSKGNKEQLDKARRIIVYSILGLVVMSVALVVVNVVIRALGLETLI